MGEYEGGHCIGFTASSKRILTRLHREHSTALWDIESGSRLRTWEGAVVTLSVDRSLIRAEETDGSSALLDAETGGPAGQGVRFASRESGRIYSPDRALFVTFTGRSRLHVWDSKSETRIGAIALTCRSTGGAFDQGGPVVEFLGDSRRIVSRDSPRWGDAVTEIWHLPSGEKVADFPSMWNTQSLGAKRIIGDMRSGKPTILCRVRPEWWWGVFCLPHLWLIVALAAALVWSGWRDVRRIRRLARAPENAIGPTG